MRSDNASSNDHSSAVANHPRLARRVRNLLAGTSSSSLAGRTRARRWNLFLRTFPDLERLNVVDLGGTPQSWSTSPIRPRSLTVINLATSNSPEPDWVNVVTGDACRAAELGLQNDYDLVFSNSTIEHVGGHDRCLAFAETVKTLEISALDPNPVPILSNRAALCVSRAPVPAHRPATARGGTLAAELYEVYWRQSHRPPGRRPVDRTTQPHPYEVLFPRE